MALKVERVTRNPHQLLVCLLVVKRNIIGLLFVKELLLHEPNGLLTIRDIDYLVADAPLYSVMQLFQMKRRHMAVVISMKGNLASFGTGGGGGFGGSPREVIGIITAEDVLEELFQTEFQDETDRYFDTRFEERVAPTPRNSELPPGLLRYVAAERQSLQIHQRSWQPRHLADRRKTMQGEPPKIFKESGGGESTLLLDV